MGKKILIIDDDVDFVESEKLLLENNGFEVIAAFDGQEGYRKALDENPDLILLDVVMTTEDEGFQIAHRLKQDTAHAHIPIIILSSLKKGMRPSGPRTQERSVGTNTYVGAGGSAESGIYPMQAGSSFPVDEYIEKPVDPQKLLSTLRRILQKNPL